MAIANEENCIELLEAEAHILNHTFKFVNSMALKCAVKLGLPDIIHSHGKPITLPHLIKAINPSITKPKSNCLHRLMRILTRSGFFITVEDEQTYWLTPSSRLLLRDGPLSLAPLLLAMLDPILMDPWHFLTEWIVDGGRGGATAFDMAHGRRRWEGDGGGRGSSFDEVFNEAMASDARFVGRVVGGDLRRAVEGLESVVDVGGARGEMAKAIAAAFPNIKCIVLDLPHVVCGLEGAENLEYVAGDMFKRIPPANAVLMKWILHCWSDEECVGILKKCKEAIPSKDKGGKVMIIEMVMVMVREGEGDDKAIETQLYFDMETMVLVNGRERSEEEWANLFFSAGFTTYKIFPILGLRCLIEAYP